MFRVLVTGGRSQIAQAVAERQLRLGRAVTVTVSDPDEAEPLQKNYAELGVPVEVVPFSLDPKMPYSPALRSVLDRGVDGLLLNAAPPVRRFRYVHKFPEEEIQAALQVNIVGNMKLLQAVLPGMLQRKLGRVVFVSSAMVQQAAGRHALYALTKSAMESLCFSIAVEYGAQNVFANILRPGIIRTERTRRFWKKESYLQKAEKLIPAGALGTPGQVAEAVEPLLSESSYMNGSIVTVAGGLPLVNLAGMG